MIQIIRETTTGGLSMFELATEKKSAFISVSSRTGLVTVCCHNAANRVWRGMGRTFQSWDDAMNGYKSSDMKAMIEYAKLQTA